jgi:HD-GYP domain-containing protein (c-di-GMP phosphodiesterase class II)
MLKKIEVSQLRLGMYLQGFDGPWIDHPFWRSRFVLDDPADLQRARGSAVRHVWIDVAQGLDVAPGELPRPHSVPPVPSAATPAPSEIPPATPGTLPQRPPTATLQDELRQAAAICKQGRQAVESMFSDARLGRALDAERCLPLVEQVSESVFRNPGALVSLARLKTADDHSFMHSVAVCALMVSLARQLGMVEAQCREAGLAGLLHDLGKAVMPPLVLNKPGKLTDDEFAIMRTHPERGHALLLEGRGASEVALEVCLHHHEKIDGRGYPHGLAGEQVTLLARMGAVCDVYDAITSNRCYKPGWDPAEPIARMASWKGHFDAAIFAAFVRSIGIYPTGSLVRMQSGRIGVVVEQSAAQPAAPVVKLFFSTKSDLPITPVRLDLAEGGSGDRIAGRESPERWGFKHIDELWLEPGSRTPAR